MKDLEIFKQKLRNMKQYKSLSDDEIEIIAKQKIEEEEVLNNLTFCIDDKEKEFAKKLLDDYLQQSNIENNADLDTLRQLIDLEVLVERMKSILKTEYIKANPSIPLQMVEQLRETEIQILEIKEKLGLVSKSKQPLTGTADWEALKKKALKYYETHAAETYCKCPYCSKLFRLLKRVDNLDPKQATMFKDNALYNKVMMGWYHTQRITKEELADAFGVSIEYIDYIYNNIYLKELKDETNV